MWQWTAAPYVEKDFLDSVSEAPDVRCKRIPRFREISLEPWYRVSVFSKQRLFQWIVVGRLIFAGNTEVNVIVLRRGLRARMMPRQACKVLRHGFINRMPCIYEHLAVHQYVQLRTVPMTELWSRLLERPMYLPVSDVMSVHELQSLQKRKR